MLPRTFLSDLFPLRWIEPPKFVYGRGDNSFSIPPTYSEQVTMADGMWDDGTHLALVTWLDRVTWPGWDIVMTYWDRASGASRRRVDIFTFPSEQAFTAPQSLIVEDPEKSAIGSITLNLHASSVFGLLGDTGLAYLRSITQAKDGSVWAHFSSFSSILARVGVAVKATTYGYNTTTSKQNMAPVLQVAQIIDPNVRTVPSKGVAPPPPAAPATYAPADGGAGLLASAKYLADSAGSVARPTTADGSISANLNFSEQGKMDSALGDIPLLSGWNGWLVLDAATHTILVNPYYGDDQSVPWNGVARVQQNVVLGFVRLPAYTKALAFEEGTRCWALLEDSTAVSFDYLTGEIFAYFWLPLPYSLGGTDVKITWQRDYRRLLVFNIIRGFQDRGTRNRFNSRISGYSTTPLPVRVCTPIPLRPVRAGRSVPFLIKQVGSLCEPIAGLATLTPGPGVAVARATIPLDETGEGYAMVTASAEGEATLTASIDVLVTWDAPGVDTPWRAAVSWIEGSLATPEEP